MKQMSLTVYLLMVFLYRKILSDFITQKLKYASLVGYIYTKNTKKSKEILNYIASINTVI